MSKLIFENKKTRVTYEEKDSISFFDLTDHYNDTKGFTRNKRGLDKAARHIEGLAENDFFNEELSMWDIARILDDVYKLKTHTYCGMD